MQITPFSTRKKPPRRQQQKAPRGTVPRENPIFHSSKYRGDHAAGSRSMQRSSKTIWRTIFRIRWWKGYFHLGWGGGSEKAPAFPRKTVYGKMCIYAFRYIYLTCTWKCLFSCSLQLTQKLFYILLVCFALEAEQFFPFRGKGKKNFPTGAFVVEWLHIIMLIIRRLYCVFCDLISVLRVTYKFKRNCNRVEKEHKRSITFHVYV